MFYVWCTLHISAPLKQQQATVGLNYESLEKGFECFSHIKTAELEWCQGKRIFRETAISQFSFFCWKTMPEITDIYAAESVEMCKNGVFMQIEVHG